MLERKRALDESKDPDCIEGVASERKRVLSCWNLNRGHGRLFDGSSRLLGNKQHNHFFYRCLHSSFCTVSFDLSPFALLTPSFASSPFPQRLGHTLPFTKFSLWCLKGFRFGCEWQLGLYRWCPCLPLELVFRRNVSMPQQGQQEIALEASNLCWH